MEQITTSKKWYDNTFIVVLLCIFFFPVGLYALWMNQSIGKGWKIAVSLFFAVVVIGAINSPKKAGETAETQVTETSTTESSATPEASEASKHTQVNQVLKTDYFDVTVNKVSLSDRINTGNQFANLKPENGINYLVVNTTFKNTDSESRMIDGGSVFIEYNGKKYEYDKAETIMLEGWGILLDQINPLTSKTTNIVYKVPTEVKGPAYYNPGRSGSDDLIYLGDLQ
jgi:hypothetical protein